MSCTRTRVNTYTHPAAKNLLLRPLWISTTRPSCIRLHPFIQQGRAGLVRLGSWAHDVPPTARCMPGKLNKLWVRLGSEKTHDAAQHMIACIKPEEVKKSWGMKQESGRCRFSAAVLFGRSLGVSGTLTALESRMQSYWTTKAEKREGGGSITCSSNHTLRQTEKKIKMGEKDNI